MLAGELHAFENLLRQTFATGGRLATAAAEVQASRQLSLTVGYQVLGAIGGANAEVGEAIARAAEAHRLLDTLARRFGIDVTAYGDVHKYPGDAVFTGADGSHLSVAA